MARILSKCAPLAPMIAFLAGLSVAANVVADESLIKSGRDIAAEHCTRCHIVGDINPRGGISSTPSFQMMVNALEDWQERFESFHARLPHPSVIRLEGSEDKDLDGFPPSIVPITLKHDDVAALTAFAGTLKKAK
ncbi:MAG: hypothetical protein AAGE89_02805 [Pseudomonadota bacterium]